MLQGVAADCKSVGATHAWFDSKMTHQHPQVAQLVEHVPEEHGVGGSIPSLGTIILMIHSCFCWKAKVFWLKEWMEEAL